MSIANFLSGRRWWLRILLGLFATIVSTIIGRWIWWERTRAAGQKELAAAIAETDALDPRWRWEQIEEDRESVPDEENSILVVKAFTASTKELDPAYFKLWDEVSKSRPAANRHFDRSQLADVREMLRKHEAALALAISFKDYPRGRKVVNLVTNTLDTPLPHAQEIRSVSKMLELDIERLLADGHPDDAMVRIQALLNAEDGLRDEPFGISQLVRVAMRKIAATSTERVIGIALPSDAALEQLANHFVQEVTEDLITPGLRGERAAISILFDNLSTGKLTFEEFLGKGKSQGHLDSLTGVTGWMLYRARLPADQAHFLRTMNEVIAIVQSPTHEQMELLGENRDRFTRESIVAREEIKNIFTFLLVPAVDKLAEAAIRDKALLRCAITAIAAERYRIAKNEWPKKLDDLCPKFMDRILLDPFDGEPLKYIFGDDGVTIYSVGANGFDDGGTKLTPTGKEPGADLGFQLWNVDQRGLPAVSKDKLPKQPYIRRHQTFAMFGRITTNFLPLNFPARCGEVLES